ncbi:MAG TPA: hypothetical protein DCG53_03895, partial [Syntrophus sp. (in: bacteria)]|nr:hypothetical protein [Syntrophus sp. (in: bacteria)]
MEKQELPRELESLRLKIADMERSEPERKRMEKAFRQQQELVTALSRTIDLRECLAVCLSSALTVSEMDCGGVYLVDEPTGGFRLAWHVGLSEVFVSALETIGPESPHVRILHAGRPVYMKHSDLKINGRKLHEGLRALAVIPICHQGKTVACLNVASHTFDETPQELRPLLESLAAQMGGFLSRSIMAEALRDREAIFKSLLSATPAGVGMLRNRIFVEVNAALCKITGYSEKELLGVSTRILYPDEKVFARVDRELYGQMDQEGLGVAEARLQRKDGAIINVLLCLSPFDPRDLTAGVCATVLDITERKLAEQEIKNKHEELHAAYQQLAAYDMELREKYDELDKTKHDLSHSEEKYRNIFENAAEGIFQTTLAGRYLNVNPAFARMFDYISPQEMIDSITNIGRHLYVNPQDRECIAGMLLEHDKVEGYEVEVYRRDKSRFWISINVHAVRDTGGNILYFEGTSEDVTERRRAKEELQKLAAIVMHSSELINLATLDGTMVFLNETGCEILGIEPERVKEVNIQDVISDHSGQIVRTEIMPVLMRDEAWEGELQYRNLKTGKLTDASAMIFTITDPVSKAPLYFANVSRDVTAHKRAVNALRETEGLYASLVDTIPDVILRTDLNGKIVFVNNHALQITGYRWEEIEGQGILMFVAPEDRDRLVQNGLLLMGGRLGPQEYQLILKDGRRIPFEVNGDVLRNDDGTPSGVVHVCRDIRERKRAEEMTRHSEEKFSKVFMTTPDCIAITRMTDGMIMDVNLGFEEITGWKLSEAVGRTSYDINFWVETSARNLMAADLQAGRDILHREFLFRCKDGSVRNGIYSARSINVAGAACLIFILQDITEQRRLEEDRQKLEQQLQQSQKLEAIGQLAGGVAHDFNNMLGAIIGHAELALNRLDVAAPLRKRLEQILDAADRSANLTRQLLAFARKQ